MGSMRMGFDAYNIQIQIMESLVERWKNVISSASEQNNPRDQPSPKKITESEHILKRSRDQKLKLSMHSQQKIKSKRMTTPSKKKHKPSKKACIESAIQQILMAINQPPSSSQNHDKAVHNRLQMILENIWQSGKQAALKQSVKPENTDAEPSLQESQMTNLTATAKKHEKLYQDLERKYFQAQKEKHFLKNKIESILNKYDNIDQQLERYAKIQKLVDRTLQREEELKQEVCRLRKQLEQSQLKQVEQQKIFQKEVISIYGLIDTIKANLHEV